MCQLRPSRPVGFFVNSTLTSAMSYSPICHAWHHPIHIRVGGVAVAAHDHEVSGDIRGMGKDCLRNIDALGRDALDLDLKSMARKMLSDIYPRQFSILCRTSYHRKYFDHLGAFKHRHRITDGASRGSTSVPTDHNAIKYCALRLNVRHDDHGTPSFEQCSLDDRYFLLRLVRLGLTDHGEVEAASKSTERIADMARRDVYHLRLGHNASLLCQFFKASYGLVRSMFGCGALGLDKFRWNSDN